jgi:putative endonuclease
VSEDRRGAGREAEDLALRFLRNEGLEVIRRNYHAPGGEIDLICREGSALVFVEVRSTSLKSPLVPPAESVGFTKQDRLRRAASHFIESGEAEELDFLDTRFDVVAVRKTPNGVEVEHLRDAFR